MKKLLVLLLTFVLIFSFLVACGSKKQENSNDTPPVDVEPDVLPEDTEDPEDLPKEHEHNHVEESRTEPSCSAKGWVKYACECGDNYILELGMVAHEYLNGVCKNCNDKDPSIKTYTVHFKNNDDWANVNAYVWITVDNVDSIITSAWPGSPMTDEGDGWYSYEFSASATDGLKLIFTDGTNQTADLLFDATKIWWANGNAYATKAAANASQLQEITVYYKNTENWDTPFYHAWNVSGGINTWPGQAMTRLEGSDNWYYATFKTATLEGLGYLFNDGVSDSGNQTKDIVYDASKLYYANGNLYVKPEDAENDSKQYADYYMYGSAANWGQQGRFVLNSDGSKTLTIDLAAGDEFKLADGSWQNEVSYSASNAFGRSPYFDWGSSNYNIKVTTSGSFTIDIDVDGNITITKN